MNPFDKKTSNAIAIFYIGNCLLIGWIGAVFAGLPGFVAGAMTGGALTKYTVWKMLGGGND